MLTEGAEDVSMGKMLRCRVRYFTDGAVIGSRGVVDEVFHSCRNRFGPKRKSGARKLRGNGARGHRRSRLEQARKPVTPDGLENGRNWECRNWEVPASGSWGRMAA